MNRVYLTEAERREIMERFERGRPLPDEYRFRLFGDERAVELVWDGKTGAVCNTVLPFQYTEHIDEPRGDRSILRYLII